MVNEGSFRQDLYYRVNVIGVAVPELRKRIDDIPDLVTYLLAKHIGDDDIVIDPEAIDALKSYPFPGNVRELENILERATALCENKLVTVEDLQLPVELLSTNNGKPSNLVSLTKAMEKEQIEAALEDNRWNQSATARSLGITLRQLRYKIEKLNLDKT